MGEVEAAVLWTRKFGFSLSSDQILLIDTYLEELLQWSRKMNLTGLASKNGLIQELLLDSLIPSSFMPEKGRLLDVGSGAGFPAIPLKVCKPGLSFHLVETKSKKVRFLKQVIRITGLNRIEVLQGRIEQIGALLHPDGYHVVTARALAKLPRAITLCAPHVMPGGILVSFQGGPVQVLSDQYAEVIHLHGLLFQESIAYTLPGKKSERQILIFTKPQDAGMKDEKVRR